MKIYLSLALFIFSFMSSAQTQTGRYIIKLKDKSSFNYSLSNPERFLSAKAIERRKKHGIAISASDLPVVTSYLEAVKSKGAKVVFQSKWLNTLIVETTNLDFFNQAASLPFVALLNSF